MNTFSYYSEIPTYNIDAFSRVSDVNEAVEDCDSAVPLDLQEVVTSITPEEKERSSKNRVFINNGRAAAGSVGGFVIGALLRDS